MSRLGRSCIHSLGLIALGAVPAAAQAVHIVSAGGSQAFPDIQAAVDAAQEGDVLLVAEGAYPEFVIDAKGLSVFVLPGDLVEVAESPSNGASIAVRNLAPSQRVVLHGLSVEYLSIVSTPLVVTQNAGFVHVQDCSFLLSQGDLWEGALDGRPGLPAAQVLDSWRVGFTASELRGGVGEQSFPFQDFAAGGEGGAGLRARSSRVALYDCALQGGDGGDSFYSAGFGGPGLHLDDAEAFVSGSSLTGGGGGLTYGGPALAPGGHGAQVWFPGVLHRLDTTLSGGPGEPPGGAFLGDGVDDPLPGSARRLELPVLAAAPVPLSGAYLGELGDLVWILSSDAPYFRVFDFGVLQTGVPVPFPSPVGVVTSSGPFVVPVDLSGLAPGVAGTQAFATGATGTRQLSGPRYTLSLDPAAGPDCNGNGINDYLDLAGGVSADADHDLVPDECP